jgi:hypothetical protein
MPNHKGRGSEATKSKARSDAYLAPKFTPLKSRSRSKPFDDIAFRAAVDLGYKQPTINMHGGVGIPGGRTRKDVVKFQRLDFRKLKTELTGILDVSKQLHASRTTGNTTKKQQLADARKKAEEVNRHVVFDNEQVGTHSLHVGNDIAAVWNNKKSKVYDYPDLAGRLDKRLASAQGKSKTYWASDKPLGERQSHVAEGIQHIIKGDPQSGFKSFQDAGLTKHGQKWALKMSTIMLAEKGREHAGSGKAQVHAALDHVKGGKSFSDVLVKHAPTHAPFAVRGGAKTFK